MRQHIRDSRRGLRHHQPAARNSDRPCLASGNRQASITVPLVFSVYIYALSFTAEVAPSKKGLVESPDATSPPPQAKIERMTSAVTHSFHRRGKTKGARGQGGKGGRGKAESMTARHENRRVKQMCQRCQDRKALFQLCFECYRSERERQRARKDSWVQSPMLRPLPGVASMLTEHQIAHRRRMLEHLTAR